jgi:hypothetical protein
MVRHTAKYGRSPCLTVSVHMVHNSIIMGGQVCNYGDSARHLGSLCKGCDTAQADDKYSSVYGIKFSHIHAAVTAQLTAEDLTFTDKSTKFLWSHLKSVAYNNWLSNTVAFQDSICVTCAATTPAIL